MPKKAGRKREGPRLQGAGNENRPKVGRKVGRRVPKEREDEHAKD